MAKTVAKPARRVAKARSPSNRRGAAASRARARMLAEDRADIAAANRAMRELRKRGGYVLYDARQLI